VDTPVLVEQDSILEAETRTLHLLNDANSDGCQHPLRMYYILVALSPSLLVKLPTDFLQGDTIDTES
jgi:hypothetical protein